jgi:hypothetical protein
MIIPFLFLGSISCSLVTVRTMAQTTSLCSNSNNLYCVPIRAVENLQVSGGGTVSGAVPPAFLGLNAAIGTQVSQLPTPSPASGFVFVFGPSGLTAERDLGPVFSERPGTVGRHKLYLEFTYQHFEFDQIDGVSLKQIPLQINGCSVPTAAAGCGDFIQTSSRLDLKVHQVTAFASFGLTSRFDVSVAIPILDVLMGMRTTCSVCLQQQPPPGSGVFLSFTPNAAKASSSGIGDVTFRLKASVIKREKTGLAVGVDGRAPTGDEHNFLGSGTWGVRPFAAFGYRTRVLSPHANVGYQFNGDSILASSDGTTPKRLPNALDYAAGVDIGVLKKLSITGDYLGHTYFSANRAYLGSRSGLGQGLPDTACTPTGVLPCQTANFNTSSFALGGKINPGGRLLITANVLFKLDNNGLHYKPAPLAGISYTF